MCRLVDVAVDSLEAAAKRGEAAHDAWNNSAVLLIRAAQAHARYFIVDCFARSVIGSDAPSYSPPVRGILSQLCELFLIYWLMERSGDFVLVQFKFFQNYNCQLVIKSIFL